MSLFKKTTAAVALVTLLSGLFTTWVSAYSTAQVTAANYLADKWIIVAHYDDPTAYNLDQNVLRQEIAAVARGVAGLDKKSTCNNVYKDVSATRPNNWACYTVEALSDEGLIALNENFRPEDYITKAEAIGMIVKAAFGNQYVYDATLSASWQKQVVDFAVANWVTSSFTNYETLATRGFVFESGHNALEAIADTDGGELGDILCQLLGICEGDVPDKDDNKTDTGSTVDTPTTIINGEMEISLSPKSPASQTIPSAGLIPFGKFDFTAGKEDVEINSITLKREWLSERTDIRRVYFEQNGIRVSNRSNVATDETVTITFTPAIVVTAGSTKTLDLIVELREAGATTWAEHRFSIVDADNIDASATVGWVFPVTTAMMRVGSYIVQTVEVREISWDSTYSVGQEDVLLSEFRLSTKWDRNNIFKSVTLTNGWTADVGSSVTNLALYRDGAKVSTEFAVSGRDLTIYVSDKIENGRSANYQLRWNIIWAERNPETYQFEVRNTSDLTVVEEEAGFSAPVDLSKVVRWWEVTIEGGDFLISRDTSYALNQTVSASTSDVVLWAAKATVAEDISVEDVLVEFTAGKLDQFSSLRFVVGDSTVSTYTPTSDTDTTVLFETNFNVRKGNTTLKILWNLKNNIADGTVYKVQDVTIGKSEARYVANDEKVEVKGSAVGITTTIADGAITLTKNDGIDNINLVPWVTDKLVFGFSLRANDVSDIRVTSLSPVINTALSGSITSSEISNVRLYQDDVLIATRNNFDFNSLDVTVKRNSSSSFKYVIDISNSAKVGQKFQLQLLPSGINARNVDSNKTIEFTTTLRSLAFEFGAGGKLEVEKNNSQVASTIFVPSTSQASVMKFDLKATNDNVRITDLYVTNSSSIVNYQASLDEWTKKYNDRVAESWALATKIKAAEDKLTTVTWTTIPNMITATINKANSLDSAVTNGSLTIGDAVAAVAQHVRNEYGDTNFANYITMNYGGVGDIGALTWALNTTFVTGAATNITTANFTLMLDATVELALLKADKVTLDNPTNADTNSGSLTYLQDNGSIATAKGYVDHFTIQVNTPQSSPAFDLSSSLRTASIYVWGKTVNWDIVWSDKIHFAFGSDGLIVKKGEVLTADVRLAFFDSDNRTNQEFQLLIKSGWTLPDEVSGTVNGIRAVSESNGEELENGTGLTLATNGIDSNKHLLMRSKPTIARLSTNEDLIGYKFTVTADSNRKIILTGIDFDVTWLTGALDWSLRRDGSNTIISNGSGLTSTSTGATISIGSFAADNEVSAGSSITYILEVFNINSAANKDRTRNIRMVGLKYRDENGANSVDAAHYNLVPTDATTYRY